MTLLATGSELHLAVEARAALQQDGIAVAVVSMHCQLLFEEQDASYKPTVLGETRARVAVEAAVQHSWDRYIGIDGGFVGMHRFGASGKIGDVYAKLGITTEAIVSKARKVLSDLGS